MFLLIGDGNDPWCLALKECMESRSFPYLQTANPLMSPSRFRWQLDNEQSKFQIDLNGKTIGNDDISGVFVRGSGWIDPLGWKHDDFIYMQSETQAALLAWLWSIDCTVLNRYPASIWYHPNKSLLLWYGLLQDCGLRVQETLLTNVEEEAKAFGSEGGEHRLTGVVYGPLTSDQRYLVEGSEWSNLAKMQQVAPVNLTHPHGSVQLACVIGEKIVWDGEPASALIDLEPSIRHFASLVGLGFLEMAFAQIGPDHFVVSVEPFPRFEHFSHASRKTIVDRIVSVLASETDLSGKDVSLSARSSSS